MKRRLCKAQPAIPQAQRARAREMEPGLDGEGAQGAEHSYKSLSGFQNAGSKAIGARRFLDRHKM